MFYTMICKQHEHEEGRCWHCQERCFVMPVLEKQIMYGNDISRMKI